MERKVALSKNRESSDTTSPTAVAQIDYIYRVTVWGNTFLTCINKFQRLQNKAIRIVIGSSWNETATPFHQVLKNLLLTLLFQFLTDNLFTSVVDCVFLFNLKLLDFF